MEETAIKSIAVKTISSSSGTFCKILFICFATGTQNMIATIKINPKFLIYQIKSASKKLIKSKANIPLIYSIASVIFSARNITQLMITTRSVYMCEKTPIFFVNFKYFSSIKNAKKYNPHTMNVTFAPCHKPVQNQVKNKLKICLVLDTLFPPSGIYK